MLRYIMRRNWLLQNGSSGSAFFTIDGDASGVETALSSGGFDANAYEHTELVGVEIIADPVRTPVNGGNDPLLETLED